MTETNPIYPKIIARGPGDRLIIGGMEGKVKYTSEWQPVEGGRNVNCRTWTIQGGDADVDGADIVIVNGWTPIQLVKAANVIVDAPEFGEADCIVMTQDGKIHKTHFGGSTKKQMVWKRGMVIAWVAESIELTEFEDPAFNDEMFKNISDGQKIIEEYPHLPLSKFRKEVNKLRKLVNNS